MDFAGLNKATKIFSRKIVKFITDAGHGWKVNHEKFILFFEQNLAKGNINPSEILGYIRYHLHNNYILLSIMQLNHQTTII